MNLIQQKILLWILPKLMAKKSPPTISRSGEEGKRVNFYSTFLYEKGTKSVVVKKFDKNKQELTILNIDTEKNEIKNLIELEIRDFWITHYYGLYQVNYTHIYKFIFYYITKFDEVKIKLHQFWSIINQTLFNRRKLITKKGMELLSFMLNDQLNRSQKFSSIKGIGVISLMTKLYTEKWILHPDSDVEESKLQLYLDSLVISGDLKVNNSSYVVTGQAIKTLEKYEEEESRHRDLARTQWIIAALTLIIALFAAAQANLIKLPTIWDFSTIRPNSNFEFTV